MPPTAKRREVLVDPTERLPLTYAGVEYLDRTRPLATREVEPDGIELTFAPFHVVGDLFRRMAQTQEFPVAEMSLSSYMLMLGQGDRRLIGLPIFPSRAFRHSQVYVHDRSGIHSPSDLVGRDVGVPEYQMTAAVWIRAFLEHDFGVTPSAVRWLTGGLVTPNYVERLRHAPPPGVHLDRIASDQTLEGMLESGELPALVTARQPIGFLHGSPNVRRLFPQYRAVEVDYFRRTRHFPIMHLVVMRRDIYAAHPWIAVSLLNAFEEAKRRGLAHLRDQDTLAIMHPWLTPALDETAALFGADPFMYGYAPNAHTLDALATYSFEQGLTPSRLDTAAMFAPESLDWVPPDQPYRSTDGAIMQGDSTV